LKTGDVVTFCGFITDITERKQAEAKLQGQLSRLNLLHKITRAIGERQDLSSIFQVIIRSLEDFLPIDFGCVCLYDAVAEALTVNSVGVRSKPLAMELAMTEQARVAIDQNGLARCVRGELVYEPDISQAQFPFSQRLAGGGLRSLVAAPLLVESSVLGVLVAARSAAQGFSSADCEFLRQLSEHAALAAHQANLYGALQQAYDDLRQSQQTVMQQERLRALGQMASGIAHDINNAISPMTLYTESLLEGEPNLSDRARDYLTTMQRSIEDVTQTVSRMREFYRQREPEIVLAPIDLNRLAQQVAELTRARWRDVPQERGIVINLQPELASNLPSVMGAEGEIRDALTNLIFNAVDAMPEGGTLTLRTRAVPASGRPGEAESAAFVRLEVCDTGVGMDEETKQHCLEPFFTTKGERGTGLGLAMVYGMVQRHSADIELESRPGKGTTVRLIFPVSAPVMTSVVRPSAPPHPAQRLRLLIVDDDPLLIKSLRDTLGGDGHLITTADSGQKGIEAFIAAEKRGEPFAVVITDLGMPHVDGRKVAAAVKAASPSTPVILLTGWGQRLMAQNDVPPHVDRLLNKPPKLHELRSALAELTAGAGQIKMP
jgi:signal transduction histidine kinase/CheY-like chemotaxis protein